MKSIFEQLQNLKSEISFLNRRKEEAQCFVPSCVYNSIGSHSISESQVLDLIAEERKAGKLVYRLKDKVLVNFKDRYLDTFHSMYRELELIDKAQSSIFRGFCLEHDSLFKQIDENKFKDTEQVRFLHSVRTISYGLVATAESLKYLNDKVIPEYEKLESLDLSAFSSIDEVLNKIPNDYQFGYPEYLAINSAIREMILNSANRKEFFKTKEQQDVFNSLGKAEFPMNGKAFKEKLSGLVCSAFVNIESLQENFSRLKSINSIYEKNDVFTLDLTNALIKSNWQFITSRSYVIGEYFPLAGSCNIKIDGIPFALTFFPETNPDKTVFILGTAIKSDLVNRIFSIFNIMDPGELRKSFSDVLLRQGSNMFFSPAYYSGLSKGLKERLISSKSPERPISDLNLFDKKYK